MPKLEEVYNRLQVNKKKRSEIAKMLKDELAHNARYKEIGEEMLVLREEKKSIEMEIRSQSADFEDLDDLKIDIATDQELLADIALNMYANNEEVEIIDEWDNKYYPQFKVNFKKSN